MKSYKNLFEKFISYENIAQAIIKGSQHKTKKKEYLHIAEHLEEYIQLIREYALNYTNDEHVVKEIFDGSSKKVRTIMQPSTREHIIQHMLVQVLEPLFKTGMYEHSYAAIPGRGPQLGKKYLEKWIRNNQRSSEIKYFVKGDIKKYFNSIPHKKLKALLSKKIHDGRILDIIFKIIDVNGSTVGIPLGFYLSQWLANWYFQDVDHYIKENLQIKYYMRYMDDIVFFGPNKKKLQKKFDDLRGYLLTEKGLELKENSGVFRFHFINKDGEDRGRFIDFMGFRFYRNRTTLRRRIIEAARDKAKDIRKKMNNHKEITLKDAYAMLSYISYFNITDTHEYYNNRIAPLVNENLLKKIISMKTREMNKKVRERLQMMVYREDLDGFVINRYSRLYYNAAFWAFDYENGEGIDLYDPEFDNEFTDEVNGWGEPMKNYHRGPQKVSEFISYEDSGLPESYKGIIRATPIKVRLANPNKPLKPNNPSNT